MGLVLVTVVANAPAADVPPGQVVRLPCIADTSIDLLAGEEREQLGTQAHIRIKGNQHIAAFAFDCAAVQGRPVIAAALHCHRGDAAIRAVTIATIQCPWDEKTACGASAGIAGCDGWGWQGDWFPNVTQGNGHSLICFSANTADAADPDWYVWTVAPDLVYALATGCAFGLSVQEVDADYSRNPTVSAREQSGQQPFLEVTLGAAGPPVGDLTVPPPTVTGDAAENLALHLTAPAGAFAWKVRFGGSGVPAWELPFAVPGQSQSLALGDLDWMTSGDIDVVVTAIDRNGRHGPDQLTTIHLPGRHFSGSKAPGPAPQAPKSTLPAGIAIIPWLDKYRADGQAVGNLPADFRDRNEVFTGSDIRLTAAHGEVVGFQVLLTGSGTAALAVTLPGCTATVARALEVDTPGGRIPDPLVQASTATLDPQHATSFQVEISVPFRDDELSAGDLRGNLLITPDAGSAMTVPIVLSVLGFALPKRASFSCELNGYGMPDRLSTFYDVQRIAYDHRAHANILWYSHHSTAPGARTSHLDMVMDDGRRMDEARYNAIGPGDAHGYWDDFITAFGPYLSGSCFQDGHRGAIPAPGFYLSFHESWPLKVRAFADPADPDAWTTFSKHPEYAQTFTAIMRDFIGVAKQQGWTGTGFQVFCNNKGASDDPTRAPWILDEPASWWDFRALGFFANLTHQAKGDHCPIDLDFRIDISRPEFARGCLDGASAADLLVVGTGPFQQYHQLVLDHVQAAKQRLWIYGGTNRVDASDRDTWGWVIEAFRDGATGVVPWQTIVTGDAALKTGDELALFLIHDQDGKTVVDRSRRLDAYLRAEEDIEYLMMVREKWHFDDHEMAEFIDHYVDLSHTHQQANEADAGRSAYPKLTPEACWNLRRAATELLLKP
jgi:hypothetical protein